LRDFAALIITGANVNQQHRAQMKISLPAVFTIAAAVVVGCATTQHATRKTFNVRDFGAVGDGTTKDTVAFQKALDACAISGGSDVVVPAGNYLIGSVQMGCATTLRLETNSVLIGSGDTNDYPMMDIRWEGRWQPGRRALIYAANVDHTGIIGPGRIEGNRAMAAPQKPLAGFSLVNVTGTCMNGISLANITGATLKNIQVTGYLGSLITQTNVQGRGLESVK